MLKRTGRKPSLRISVFGRSALEKYRELEAHIVVSVSDPGTNPVLIPDNANCVDVLRLEFEDEQGPQGCPFDAAMARQILTFARLHHARIKAIVVGCEMGQSRSAGIAAALSEVFNGTSESFFKRFSPNQNVYTTLLDIAHEGD